MCLSATTGFAQGRNFAGTWVHDDEKTRVANGITGTPMGGVAFSANGEASQSGAPPMVVVVDGSSITIGVRKYQAGGTTTFELRGDTYKTKAEWKDDKLVIEETIATPNGPIVNTLSWYIEAAHLVRETPSPNRPQKVLKAYYTRVKAATDR